MEHDEADNDEWTTPKGLREQAYVDKISPQDFDIVKDIIKSRINVKNASVTIVGKRRSGKSVLIRDFYYSLKPYYKTFYLCTNTYDTNIAFWDFIDPQNVIRGIDEARLAKIFKEQEDLVKSAGDNSKVPYICIIFDDIITSETGARYSDFISTLYANGRHYNTMSILATQSLKKISKHARDNTDITICYRLKNLEDRKTVVEENFEVPTPGIGLKLLRKVCSVEHQAIVFLNYLIDGDISTVRKYIANAKHKAPQRRTITVGTRTNTARTFSYGFGDH